MYFLFWPISAWTPTSITLGFSVFRSFDLFTNWDSFSTNRVCFLGAMLLRYSGREGGAFWDNITSEYCFIAKLLAKWCIFITPSIVRYIGKNVTHNGWKRCGLGLKLIIFFKLTDYTRWHLFIAFYILLIYVQFN